MYINEPGNRYRLKNKAKNGEIKEHLPELDKHPVHFSILQPCYWNQESELIYVSHLTRLLSTLD